jgi:mannose-1-phosphate guanylyltransferase / mannose-6-phosphate isomerase
MSCAGFFERGEKMSFINPEVELKMTTKKIIPLILCGGSGTRLWPLSRWNKPKQFMRLYGQHSLLEQTLIRCKDIIFDARPIIVGAQAHAPMLKQATKDVGIDAEIILEPERRESCAAIVAGVLVAAKRGPKALVMMMTADHDIPDSQAFAQAAEAATSAAEQGHIVTFGIKPLKPATGYGYILPGGKIPDSAACYVQRFVEKPDRETAKYYLEHGYLWNSGNFMLSIRHLLQEISELAPDVLNATTEAVAKAEMKRDGLLLDKDAFFKSPRISFDYAIMEKTTRAAVLPVDYAWNDIGSWDAVAEISPEDGDGNSSSGIAHIKNSRNVYVRSEGVTTVVVGCEDISVITTPEAVLVVRKGMSENIKLVVDNFYERDKR